MIRCYASSTIALLLVSVLGPLAHAAAPDVQNVIDQRVQSGMTTGLVVGIVRAGLAGLVHLQRVDVELAQFAFLGHDVWVSFSRA